MPASPRGRCLRPDTGAIDVGSPALSEISPHDERADQAHCRASLAHGSKTFRAASLMLPVRVREPASALYAFCRLADDAVDGDAGRAADPVAALRLRIRLAYAGTPRAAAADRALARVVARHRVPERLFEALLEGFDWDRQGRRYETIETLHDYAARVAGSVGAMMALLMGVRSAEALARACDLGVAMQLSNIARDVGEDARMGRLYLPRAWLAEAGIDADAWLAAPVPSPALATVVRRVLDEADRLYRRVDAGIALLPLDCRPGIGAARLLYAAIGHEVARRGFDPVTSRARVPGWRKAGLLVCAVAAAGSRRTGPAVPALSANRFLVDAAAVGPAREGPRPVTDRVGWTLELFASLEQRERRVAVPRVRRA